MKNNDLLVGKIIDYTHEGLGLMKVDTFPIFVRNAMLGEKVLVKIKQIKKNYAYANLIEIIEESNNRDMIKCPYYELCGSCNIMHLKYQEQVSFKKKVISNIFNKNKIVYPKVDFIVNDNPLFYRNKISLKFANDDMIRLAYNKGRSNEKVIIDKCLLVSDKINEIISKIVDVINDLNIDKRDLMLILKSIVIKTNEANDYLIGIELNNIKVKKDIIQEIRSLNGIFDNKLVFIENNSKLDNKYLLNKIDRLQFKNSITSFFQVNTYMIEKLYNKAINYLDINEDDIILDAYCGVGTISCLMARNASKVMAIDINKQAIKNAKDNAIFNDISNVDFLCCDVEDYMIENKKMFSKIVIDPPRNGCTKAFLDIILTMDFKSLVYISCNPATMARDIKYLQDNGFKLEKVCGVDMFSQTYHVECVGLITRKK